MLLKGGRVLAVGMGVGWVGVVGEGEVGGRDWRSCIWRRE